MQTASKILSFAFVLFAAADVNAANYIDCTATAVYGGPLEESFSVDEYPEVTVTEALVSIGASQFSVADGDSIELTETATHFTALIVLGSGQESYEIRVNKKTKKAVIDYFTDNVDETGRIAVMTCK